MHSHDGLRARGDGHPHAGGVEIEARGIDVHADRLGAALADREPSGDKGVAGYNYSESNQTAWCDRIQPIANADGMTHAAEGREFRLEPSEMVTKDVVAPVDYGGCGAEEIRADFTGRAAKVVEGDVLHGSNLRRPAAQHRNGSPRRSGYSRPRHNAWRPAPGTRRHRRSRRSRATRQARPGGRCLGA